MEPLMFLRDGKAKPKTTKPGIKVLVPLKTPVLEFLPDVTIVNYKCTSNKNTVIGWEKAEDNSLNCYDVYDETFVKKVKKSDEMWENFQRKKNNVDGRILQIKLKKCDATGKLLPDNPPNHKCQKCNKLFSRRSYLKNHDQIHSNELRFSCQKCDKHFKQKEGLNQHEAVHKRKFKCSSCGEEYRCFKRFRKHLTSHRDSDSDSDVPMLMPFKKKLKKEKPKKLHDFKCSYCDKCFKRKEVLKNHIYSHVHVQAPFKCNLCSRSFQNKSNLNRHARKQHALE